MNDSNEKYWSYSGQGCYLGSAKEDEKPKTHDFSDVVKYSVRSNKHQPQVNTITSSSQPNSVGGPVSIISESDLISPSLNCTICGKIITDVEQIKFEGNKVFTDEKCWKHWMDRMITQEHFNLKDLVSHAAKKYYLDQACGTCNGRLIIKTLLILKGAMGEFEFGALVFDNIVAYNHYMTFLRETRQSDEKLSRCRSMFEEPMKNLREIMRDNIQVDASSVHQFIRKLVELKDEVKLNANLMPIQWEMIEEYATLLNWQAKNYENFINMSLVSTAIEAQLSYHAIKDNSTIRFLRDNFKMTPEEFFWTCLKPIVMANKISEIDKILKSKDFGSKPAITYERIVSFLYSCSKEPDDFKMQCLLKISNTEDLVDCANQFKLLDPLRKYCIDKKENSHLKRIDQYLQNLRR